MATGSLGGFAVANQQQTAQPTAQQPGQGAPAGGQANVAGFQPQSTGFQPAAGGGQSGFAAQSPAASQTPAAPAYTGAPTSASGFGQGAPSGTVGAPNSAQGPTMQNQQTGNFNTNYITPGQSAVSSVQAGPAYDQAVTQAHYAEQQRMLDPQWQHQQQDAESQLANMGLSRGSEAWNREKQRLDMAQADAYGSARNQSILAGGQESSRQLTDQIAAGNFANQAGQQNYENQVMSQNTQNAANAAQQNAAQGWQGYKTTERGQDLNLKAANQNAAAQASAARANAQDQRYIADQNYALQNRQMNLNEGRFAYDVTTGMNLAPDAQRNAAVGNYQPPGNPSYGNVAQGNYGNVNGQGYAEAIAGQNTAGAGAVSSGAGAATGAVKNYFGGQGVGANGYNYNPYQGGYNYGQDVYSMGPPRG